MKTALIRKKFLTYFAKQNHQIVASSSLVPEDESLLFTSAGMVQFKELFLTNSATLQRATSVQRCMRAGGKHNDLENVGFSNRHHTFFEMLGNFSFNDYFKFEAIEFAWDFLTNILGIEPKRLWITVHHDDLEAEKIWQRKIKPERLIKLATNFWQMADTGPCGPCSEIFYDYDYNRADSAQEINLEDDRFIEIWNLVFIEYNRDTNGLLNRLPNRSIDTGMGLERIASVMQNTKDNYAIDIFKNLITKISQTIQSTDLKNPTLRILADHIRASSFLIMDGVLPGNEGREYVLRRILRRAIRYGYRKVSQPFFYKFTNFLADEMKDDYPKLYEMREKIANLIFLEEKLFFNTLERGMHLFYKSIKNLTSPTIPGHLIFKLYDTYGFPIDLTESLAREERLNLDIKGFQENMAKQKIRSKKSSKFNQDISYLHDINKTEFQGYREKSLSTTILALIKEEKRVDQLKTTERGSIILAETVFYGESGGQIGDNGEISNESFIFKVEDTQKKNGIFLHIGYIAKGECHEGAKVTAKFDIKKRELIEAAHSAVHMLNSALERVLRQKIKQSGSYVTDRYIRFDFNHHHGLTDEEIYQVEKILNREITKNHKIKTDLMNLDEIDDQEIKAQFTSKYSQIVRVVQIGDFSKELCGGTHTKRSGNIGLCKIVKENAIAQGVRRIELLFGKNLLNHIQKMANNYKKIGNILHQNEDNLILGVERLQQREQILEEQLAKFKNYYVENLVKKIRREAIKIGDLRLLTSSSLKIDGKTLAQIMRKLESLYLKERVIILITVYKAKVQILVSVTTDVADLYPAVKLMNLLTEKIGGRGGGDRLKAYGGGGDASLLPQVFDLIHKEIDKKSSK